MDISSDMDSVWVATIATASPMLTESDMSSVYPSTVDEASAIDIDSAVVFST